MLNCCSNTWTEWARRQGGPSALTAAPWYNKIGHFNYTDADSQAIAAPSTYTLDRGTSEISGNGSYDPTLYNNSGDVMPTTGAANGLELIDLRGKSYDDPQWEELLHRLTVEETVELITTGGHSR